MPTVEFRFAIDNAKPPLAAEALRCFGKNVSF